MCRFDSDFIIIQIMITSRLNNDITTLSKSNIKNTLS